MPGERTADDGGRADLVRPIEPWRCLQLVEAVPYGRLATVEGGSPLLVVLNHVVEDGDIYFRTRADARLVRLTQHGPVKAEYEVDSAFPAGQLGWSVIAHGLLSCEHGGSEWAAIRSRLTAWAGGERDVVLRLDVQAMTGRFVGPT